LDNFERYIGIDYSGAGKPADRLSGLRVFVASVDTEPEEKRNLNDWNWTRHILASWVEERLREPIPTLIGIDHAFAFPSAYMERHHLKTWDEFLSDFHEHWPTDVKSVEELRKGNARTGETDELRLTEMWTPSAKSVFLFDVPGSVAKSTHAGLPWLWRIRQAHGHRIHFWPFDGFEVPTGKSVIAEIYPSLFRHRYPHENRKPDQQDAFATCAWLKRVDENGFLRSYFKPPLLEEECQLAKLEGWILGVV